MSLRDWLNDALLRHQQTCPTEIAYDRTGLVSESEVSELLNEVRAFRSAVVGWLRSTHPELLGEQK